jgi:hypothetical protein
MRRRRFLQWVLAAALTEPSARLWAAATPTEVAGIALPRSPRALAAAAYARVHCPDFLFNHCMRTYVFGALRLAPSGRRYRAEDAFVAASLHDLGLLPAFESARGSFETDGANAAEQWARRQGMGAQRADLVWHAVQMHDGAWALTRRQGAEAMLVALGAATDVDGPDPADLPARQVAEVIAAFPRLRFKEQFTALLVAHCQRKPDSQRATWLEGLCRAHGARPSPDESVAAQIAAAAFDE